MSLLSSHRATAAIPAKQGLAQMHSTPTEVLSLHRRLLAGIQSARLGFPSLGLAAVDYPAKAVQCTKIPESIQFIRPFRRDRRSQLAVAAKSAAAAVRWEPGTC